MALEEAIADIVEKLREGAFPNEQSVSQGVVLRVLSDLHWDVFETSVVWPEYPTKGGGRADFALCEPRSRPKVLIEVKQPGKAEGGVEQSLGYAFKTGVPFVVLTDGQTWSFYLPAEPGDYEDRRVFKLDLYEHPVERSANVLEGYLHWRAVASGKALEDARREHRSKARQALARQAIPEAWQRLVEQRDELLVELVSDAVESKEGVRPDDEDVARFLAGLETSGTIRPLPPRPDRPVPPPPDLNPRAQGVVTVFGNTHPYRNAKERLVIVLRELAKRDPAFLERCYQSESFSGRTRRYIGRHVEELYPTNAKLQKTAVESLPGGWLLGTNLSNA
ncbi:MAG: hypothetical protein F4X81_08295, partial [Gammaproteobacteria bacterium]|nr:hypothetical protein [Gammaproteobacteria bacterium]